jgi:transcriptional regulator with AAA-type ATPase domain
MSAPPSTDPVIEPWRLPVMEPASRLHALNFFDPTWEAALEAACGTSYRRGARAQNLESLAKRLVTHVIVVAARLAEGARATPAERAIYEGAAVHLMWDEFAPKIQGLIDRDALDVPFFDDFVKRHGLLFSHPWLRTPEPGHLFALMYQVHRAWYFPATKIRGGSPSALATRAAVFRASLGSDIGAYADGLYRHMHEIPVLITGETGTGKEEAAQCVGWSRYIPFDRIKNRLVAHYRADHHARNLCEVPREMIDSALFGYKRGAFTGALSDAKGYFALPGPHGSLFLDEVGEMPEHVQVKLLRPLQSRDFVPLGETSPQELQGRLLFATNRNLEEMCAQGEFHADLLERMNGVHIHMPPLRQMLAEAPGELRRYARMFVAAKIDDPARVEAWTERVVKGIAKTRPGDAWYRNVRELKNYTERYILTDGRMPPPAARPAAAANEPAPETTATPVSTCQPSSGNLGPNAKAGNVPADEVMRSLVTHIYFLTGLNKSETARRTGLNWRTVDKLIDHERLARWLAHPPEKPDKP